QTAPQETGAACLQSDRLVAMKAAMEIAAEIVMAAPSVMETAMPAAAKTETDHGRGIGRPAIIGIIKAAIGIAAHRGRDRKTRAKPDHHAGRSGRGGGRGGAGQDQGAKSDFREAFHG